MFTCFAFDKAVKLAMIGFTSSMTADLACQISSCLCQDYNIVLLFKQDISIHWKRRVHFTLSQEKKYKD